MNDEQYRRIRSAIKADAVDRAHANLDEMVTTEDGFDDLLETMLRAEADISALDKAHELESMKRMVEMADDVSLIAATEPPDDAEADGTND